jgi:sporulation protein YlmC with PRC-barrel domain
MMIEKYKDNITGKNEDIKLNYPLNLLTANTIIGDKVKNYSDENMGIIHDIMLDIHTGKIEYFIIEFGGFLGIGEKFFAIPFYLLKVDLNEKLFRFDENRQNLLKAPVFDKNHWPKTNVHNKDFVTLNWSFWENPTGEE